MLCLCSDSGWHTQSSTESPGEVCVGDEAPPPFEKVKHMLLGPTFTVTLSTPLGACNVAGSTRLQHSYGSIPTLRYLKKYTLCLLSSPDTLSI